MINLVPFVMTSCTYSVIVLLFLFFRFKVRCEDFVKESAIISDLCFRCRCFSLLSQSYYHLYINKKRSVLFFYINASLMTFCVPKHFSQDHIMQKYDAKVARSMCFVHLHLNCDVDTPTARRTST